MLLSPPPKLQFFDANGNPLVGGKLHTYLAGTTTPQATYQDKAGVSANTNPIILDARGEASVWLDPAVLTKFTLETAEDVEIWSVDNIGSIVTEQVVDGDLRVKGNLIAEGDVTAFATVVPLGAPLVVLPTYDTLVALVNDLIARVTVLEGP